MDAQHHIPKAERGLQAERTSLAWTRVLLSFMVFALALLKWAPMRGEWLLLILIPIAIPLLLGTLTQRPRYARLHRNLNGREPTGALLSVLGIGISVALAGVICLLVLIWG